MWQRNCVSVPSSVRRSAPPQSGQVTATGSSSLYSAVMPRPPDAAGRTRSTGALAPRVPDSDESSAEMPLNGRQWSITTCLIALRGMPGSAASAGSWTTVVPPCCLTSNRPAVPSFSPL